MKQCKKSRTARLRFVFEISKEHCYLYSYRNVLLRAVMIFSPYCGNPAGDGCPLLTDIKERFFS